MPPPPPLVLDVRPWFEAGRPPLGAILAAVERLAPGQTLCLIAPLYPAPLCARLEQRGFTVEGGQRTDGVWELRFTPPADGAG